MPFAQRSLTVAGTVKNDVYLDKKRELEKRVAAPLATGNNKYLLEQVNGFDLSEIDKPALKACVTSFATSAFHVFSDSSLNNVCGFRLGVQLSIRRGLPDSMG